MELELQIVDGELYFVQARQHAVEVTNKKKKKSKKSAAPFY